MIVAINGPIFAMEDHRYVIKTSNLPNETRPQADTDHYHILKNKLYRSTDYEKESYLTTIWAQVSEYYVERSRSTTIGFTVTPTSGSFVATDVASTGAFNVSYTKTFSVGSYIPANSAKDSKLVILAEYGNYTGDLYYVIDYGYTKHESYKGTGKIRVPEDLYLRVEYKGEPVKP